jgi:hypothetical protein
MQATLTQAAKERCAANYTGDVRSVTDDSRQRTIARVLDLSIPARIQLALSLGDDDLTLFARTSGLAREEARRRLRQQRENGRAVSRAAAIGDR